MSPKHINRFLILTILTSWSWGVTMPATAQSQPTSSVPTAADLEINVYGDRLLKKPIYSPFRQQGTLQDSTRPAYVIDKNEIKAQGARTV
jgi:vitamin B12 transporter